MPHTPPALGPFRRSGRRVDGWTPPPRSPGRWRVGQAAREPARRACGNAVRAGMTPYVARRTQAPGSEQTPALRAGDACPNPHQKNKPSEDAHRQDHEFQAQCHRALIHLANIRHQRGGGAEPYEPRRTRLAPPDSPARVDNQPFQQTAPVRAMADQSPARGATQSGRSPVGQRARRDCGSAVFAVDRHAAQHRTPRGARRFRQVHSIGPLSSRSDGKYGTL